jgi:RNA polymerase-binding transcription factor DksA
MESLILERMHKGLLQKQDSLTEWLHATPLSKKKVLLGPSSEQSVHARLDVIDDAISKADSKTLGKCEVCHEDVETELLEVDYTASVCIEHLSKEERRHLESEL